MNQPPPPPTAEESVDRLRHSLMSVFRGRPETVDLLITAFVAGGHVLLEDIPGVGKTTLGQALAMSIGGRFHRLQCTPDLMPADITGLSIWDERERAFVFQPGPIFCDVLLADELNRTPPRTQSALLEAMNEGQVTIDGTTRRLSTCFFTVATQNPTDHVGTYPLPDSQRDRFLLAFTLGYPERARELDLLEHDGAGNDLARLSACLGHDDVVALRAQARSVHISPEVRNYLLDLIQATRTCKALTIGASPRAALGLQRASQARAVLQGRDFVIPDDVQGLAVPALAHRVVARVGQGAREVVSALIESLEVPR